MSVIIDTTAFDSINISLDIFNISFPVILVYLFFIPVVEATSYSLLIVGLTALFGSIEYFRRKSIDIKTAISFGAPSIIGVLIARKYLLPSVPDQFNFGILITKDFYMQD